MSSPKKINKKTFAADAVQFIDNILESSIEYSIIALDLQGNILSWNSGARNNYGYQTNEMINKQNILVLHTPEDIKSRRVENFMKTAQELGKAEGIFERVRKNGGRFPASVTLTLRRNTKGKPIGFLLISKDITEQKRLEEQLKLNEELSLQNISIQETNRLKSAFLANMSHELRTPLNAIIGFSELMHEEMLGPINEEQKDGLKDIMTSAKHLLRIINDLLDLSKIEAGKMGFSPQECAPSKLIKEVIDSLGTWPFKKNIHLVSNWDNFSDSAYLDPTRFKQIVYNLLSNAIKFTPDLGTIKIRLKPHDDKYFCLEVEDNGIGIAMENLNKLFSSFTQLDNRPNRKYTGTGLGLAITKHLVEAQNGSISISSKLGKGSTFLVIMPYRYEEASSIETHRDATVTISAVEKDAHVRSILVIEDTERCLKMITNTLVEQGYYVETASLGKQAIEYCKKRLFDLITLDLVLPDCSGFEILKEIRSSINKNTPIIVISVVPKKEQLLSFKIQDYLVKPFNKQTLLAAVQKNHKKIKKQYRIIAIDDDPLALKFISKLLQKNGYMVIGVSQPENALETIKHEQPDLIVLDLLMPQQSGNNLLNHFNKSELGKSIPIVVWTAKDLSNHEETSLRKKTEAIILKSIGDSGKQLLAAVNKIFAKKSKGSIL